MHSRVLVLFSLAPLALACSLDEVAFVDTEAETGDESPELPDLPGPPGCDALPEQLDTAKDSWIETEDIDVLLRDTAILPDGDFVAIMSDLVVRGAADGTLRWAVEAGSADSLQHVDTNAAGEIVVFAWAGGHPVVVRYDGDGERGPRVALDDPNGEILNAGAVAPTGEVLTGFLLPDAAGAQVRKLDVDLDEVWSVTDDVWFAVVALAADADGNVYYVRQRFGHVIEDYPASPALLAWYVDLSARDAAGELLWSTGELEFPSINVPRTHLELGDGLYMWSTGEPHEDASVWAFDTDGELQWQLRDGDLDALAAAPCGGLYAAGGHSTSASTWRIDADGSATSPTDLGVPTLEGFAGYRVEDVMVSSFGHVVVVGSVGEGYLSDWRWWTQRY